jgi:WD40 repeat protein
MLCKGDSGIVVDMDFSPAAPILATLDVDDTVHLWNITSGERLDVLREGRHGNYNLAFRHDGLLAVGGVVSQWWDVHSRTVVRTIKEDSGEVSWSPDGRWLACSAEENFLTLRDGKTSKIVRVLEQPTAAYTAFGWLSDSKQLAAGGSMWNTAIMVWDMDQAGPVAVLPDDKNRYGNVETIVFDSNHSLIISANYGYQVRWDFASDTLTKRYRAMENKVEGYEVRIEGCSAATSDGRLLAYGQETGRWLKQSDGSQMPVGGPPEGYPEGFGVHVADVITGNDIHRFEGHEEGLTRMKFNHAGTLLATADFEGKLFVWDI